MALLWLDNLSKSYGALRVTDSVSLDGGDGEIVGILGPNGACKTTLFNLIAGTVVPNAGKVTSKGQDVTGLDASARCRLGISRSFQIPHPFVGMTVFENLLVGAIFGRDGTDGIRRAAGQCQSGRLSDLYHGAVSGRASRCWPSLWRGWSPYRSRPWGSGWPGPISQSGLGSWLRCFA